MHMRMHMHTRMHMHMLCSLGFPVVLRALAEDGAPRLQAAAAWVAGTAVQNNRELQLALVAQGLLPALLRLVGAHAVPEVRAKALYAASGLLRACPEAQAQFTVHDGLAQPVGGAVLFERHCCDTPASWG